MKKVTKQKLIKMKAQSLQKFETATMEKSGLTRCDHCGNLTVIYTVWFTGNNLRRFCMDCYDPDSKTGHINSCREIRIEKSLFKGLITGGKQYCIARQYCTNCKRKIFTPPVYIKGKIYCEDCANKIKEIEKEIEKEIKNEKSK